MMRPVCTYSSGPQSGLTNGLDVYSDRESYGFGMIPNAPQSVQPMQSMGPIYAAVTPVSSVAPGSLISSGVLGPGMNASHSSQFGMTAYTHLQQQSYSSPVLSEAMQPAGVPIGSHSFQHQQQQSYQSVGPNPVTGSDKMIMPSGRSLLNGPGYMRGMNQSGAGSVAASQSTVNNGSGSSVAQYGMIPGPICSVAAGALTSSQQQRIVHNQMSRNMPQSLPISRPTGPRQAASILSEPSGYPQCSTYMTYPSGVVAPTVGSVPAPYSINMPNNSTIAVTISPMLNSVASTFPTTGQHQPVPVPNRMGAQQRVSTGTAVYSSPSYVGQYVPSGVQLRPGVNNPINMPTVTSTVSSSQLSKDICLPMQPSATDSMNSSTNGNGVNNFNKTGLRPSGVTLFSGGQINPSGCNLPASNTAVTPPAGIIIGGPGMMGPMNGCLTVGPDADTKLGPPMNPDACYLSACGGNRPLSSDPRDAAMVANGPIGSASGGNSTGAAGGVGTELLISSSPFHHMPNAASGIGAPPSQLTYAPSGPQIPVLSGEFDGMGPNSSPVMMMAMPASSPLINGPVPTGVMNMPMVNSTPAPPPYHQHHQHHPPTSSLANCQRSMVGHGGGAFFGPTSIPVQPVTVTTGVHLNAMPTMSVDGRVVHPHSMTAGPTCGGAIGLPSIGSGVERHQPALGVSTGAGMMSIVDTPASAKQGITPGTNTKTRPKRARAKNTTGTGRVSKASAKKNLSANNCTVASTNVLPGQGLPQDVFMMKPRLTVQAQQVRQKISPWNANMCPPGAPVSYSSGVVLSPNSMNILDGRANSGISPVPFPGQSIMRSVSGPPSSSFGSNMSMIHGCLPPSCPVSTNVLLDPSLRMHQSSPRPPYSISASAGGHSGQLQSVLNSVTLQQQQCFPNAAQTSSGGFSAFPANSNTALPSSLGATAISTSSVCTLSNPQSLYHAAESTIGETHRSHCSTIPVPSRTTALLHAQSATTSNPPSGTASGTSSTPNMEANNAQSKTFSNNIGPSVPVPTSTDIVQMGNSSEDENRLVCPITNGRVWGPIQIEMDEILHSFLPDGVLVKRFDFDISGSHLHTIINRTDLDIVICSHLVSEPPQVCHWPLDTLQLRFNNHPLRLERYSVMEGAPPAHKVASVKHLCRPGKNVLDVAILDLSDDPTQPSTSIKRRAAASTLEAHRFVAFMAHMPSVNVLLDGLQRRRPLCARDLCDMIEARIGTNQSASNEPSGQFSTNSSPIVTEVSLICPLMRTQVRVPSRMAGCRHVEVFDLEAFLQREVLWPRLMCPICGFKSEVGLDGLCIDMPILNALRLLPPFVESILVRTDGYWRLSYPKFLDLPYEIDQWHPLVGPVSEPVLRSFLMLRHYSSNASRSACQSSGPVKAPGFQLPPSPICTGPSPSSSPCSMPRQMPLTQQLPTSQQQQQFKASHTKASPAMASIKADSIISSSKFSSPTLTQPLILSRPASQPTTWLSGPVTTNSLDETSTEHQYPLSDPAVTFSDTLSTPGRCMNTNVSTIARRGTLDPISECPPSSLSETISNTIQPSLTSFSQIKSTDSPLAPIWTISSDSGMVVSPTVVFSHSLPPSPVVYDNGSRKCSGSFPIPAIPGVNMHVATTISPTTTTTAIINIFTTTTPPARLSSPDSLSARAPALHAPVPSSTDKANISGLGSDVGSPSPDLAPITAAAVSAFMVNEDDHLPTKTTLNHSSVSSITKTSDIGACRKPTACSSLNMGLDYLLTDDQTATSIVIPEGVSVKDEMEADDFNCFSCPKKMSVQFYNAHAIDCPVTVNSNEQSKNIECLTVTDSTMTGMVSPAESTGGIKRMHSQCKLESAATGTEDQPWNQTMGDLCEPKIPSTSPVVSSLIKPSFVEDRQIDRSQCAEKDHFATSKRIKLDSCANDGSIAYGHQMEKWELKSASGPTHYDGHLSKHVQSSKIDNREHANNIDYVTMEELTSNYRDATEDNPEDTNCSRLKQKFVPRKCSMSATLPQIPTEMDEEHVSADLVLSISSQVDRMDMFLDESYVQFIESFSCI